MWFSFVRRHIIKSNVKSTIADLITLLANANSTIANGNSIKANGHITNAEPIYTNAEAPSILSHLNITIAITNKLADTMHIAFDGKQITFGV